MGLPFHFLRFLAFSDFPSYDSLLPYADDPPSAEDGAGGRGGPPITFLAEDRVARLESPRETHERESVGEDALDEIHIIRVSVFFDTEDFLDFLEALAREPRRGDPPHPVFMTPFAAGSIAPSLGI